MSALKLRLLRKQRINLFYLSVCIFLVVLVEWNHFIFSNSIRTCNILLNKLYLLAKLFFFVSFLDFFVSFDILLGGWYAFSYSTFICLFYFASSLIKVIFDSC